MGKSRNYPERAFFGPIGAFGAKPPFAKPFLGEFLLTPLHFMSRRPELFRTFLGKASDDSLLLKDFWVTKPNHFVVYIVVSTVKSSVSTFVGPSYIEDDRVNFRGGCCVYFREHSRLGRAKRGGQNVPKNKTSRG